LVADGGTVVVSLTSQKYLYIPFHNGSVYGYAIDGTTGALTSVPRSPYAVVGGTSITANPAGTFLFVSDAASGDISVFSISATNGSLTAVGSPFASGIAAAQLTTDGLGKYLYATAGTGGAQVAAMSIGSTGALTLVPGSPFSFPMSKVLGENSGNFLLGITGFSNDIHVFSIDSTGAIAEASTAGSPFATAALPLNLVVHPSGTYVYALDGFSTGMEGYEIQASGALKGITGSPFTAVDLDAGEFDQSGKYLFGVGEGSVTASFGPYGVDTSSGAISTLTLGTLGFPGGGIAVSDLNDAP
jgi:6-phosphogluconolactonase (cycloisomerase 2 family)